MKFKKVRNQKTWKAENDTVIRYNYAVEKYSVERKTFFAFADTLAEAKKIATTDSRFNKF